MNRIITAQIHIREGIIVIIIRIREIEEIIRIWIHPATRIIVQEREEEIKAILILAQEIQGREDI